MLKNICIQFYYCFKWILVIIVVVAVTVDEYHFHLYFLIVAGKLASLQSSMSRGEEENDKTKEQFWKQNTNTIYHSMLGRPYKVFFFFSNNQDPLIFVGGINPNTVIRLIITVPGKLKIYKHDKNSNLNFHLESFNTLPILLAIGIAF